VLQAYSSIPAVRLARETPFNTDASLLADPVFHAAVERIYDCLPGEEGEKIRAILDQLQVECAKTKPQCSQPAASREPTPQAEPQDTRLADISELIRTTRIRAEQRSQVARISSKAADEQEKNATTAELYWIDNREKAESLRSKATEDEQHSREVNSLLEGLQMQKDAIRAELNATDDSPVSQITVGESPNRDEDAPDNWSDVDMDADDASRATTAAATATAAAAAAT
jgi:hypothetical protein